MLISTTGGWVVCLHPPCHIDRTLYGTRLCDSQTFSDPCRDPLRSSLKGRLLQGAVNRSPGWVNQVLLPPILPCMYLEHTAHVASRRSLKSAYFSTLGPFLVSSDPSSGQDNECTKDQTNRSKDEDKDENESEHSLLPVHAATVDSRWMVAMWIGRS